MTEVRVLEWVPASNLRRLVNWLVDRIVIAFMAGVGYSVAQGMIQGFMSGLTGEEAPAPAGGPVLLLCLYLAVYVGYYVFMEGVAGCTVGKVLTGTRVMTYGRQQPRLGQVIVRTLARFLPLEPLSFLACSSGWHDSLSRTAVLKRVPRRQAEALRGAQARFDAHERELCERRLREP